MGKSGDLDDPRNADELFRLEQAGVLSGRLGRSLPAGHGSDPAAAKAKARREADQKTALDLAMLDETYAARFNLFMGLLSSAETDTQSALEAAEAVVRESKEALSDIQDRANQLADGKRVYLSAIDGEVYTEDGQAVSPEERASIVLKDGAPTREEFQRAEKALTEAETRADEVRRFQADLGEMRERMNDPDNPPSMDNMDVWTDRIETFENRMNDKLSPTETASPTSAPFDYGRPTL